MSGASHTLTDQLAGGYGFTAIIVAWLSKFNTIIMVFVSLLLVFLERGTGELSSTFRIIPTASGKILVGLVLFFIIACEFFVEYRLVFRSGKERKETSSGGPVTRFFYRVDAFMVAVLHKIAGFFVRVGKAIIGCFAKKSKGGEQE